MTSAMLDLNLMCDVSVEERATTRFVGDFVDSDDDCVLCLCDVFGLSVHVELTSSCWFSTLRLSTAHGYIRFTGRMYGQCVPAFSCDRNLNGHSIVHLMHTDWAISFIQ